MSAPAKGWVAQGAGGSDAWSLKRLNLEWDRVTAVSTGASGSPQVVAGAGCLPGYLLGQRGQWVIR
jgi:hypothetical protein